MTAAAFDVAIRAGAISLLSALAILLFVRRRAVGLPAILFAPLAVCLSGFVLRNTPFATLVPGGSIAAFAHAVSGFAVVFLWWFCLACFDARLRIRGFVLAVGIGWAVVAALDRGLLGEFFADRGLTIVLLATGFAIVGHLIWRLLTEREGDLVFARRDARVMVALLLGGMLCVDLFADALFGFEWRPLGFSMAQNATILGFCGWLAGRLLDVRGDVLRFGVSAVPPRRTRAATSPLADRLHRLMEQDRPYLDPDLTLAGFVARMGATERTVRTLINHELGYDHFRSFLNHYRVAEARRLLAAGDCDTKLSGIAMDSGFASLASFNRAFRAVEGQTPSAYRAAAQGRASQNRVHAAF